MRDLTSQRAALHIKTRRLKLLFVLSGGLWICGGGAHTNVLARHTIASCQIPLIGTAEQMTLAGEAFEKKMATIIADICVLKKS